MTLEMALVFAILGVTILLFVSDRIRLDLVALLALLALLLTGILTPEEALAGFSDPIVLIIAGLFVVGGGLFRTGVAGAMGRWLSRVAGGNPVRLTVVTMLVVAFLSAFMSSTGATAVLVPVVVSLAWNARTHPSKLLIPLAFGALLGGMLTLIGTPPNIVVSNQLKTHGLEPFNFFAFTPFGLLALAVGILFIVLAGRHLLPEREDEEMRRGQSAGAPTLEELAKRYDLPAELHTLRVRRPSPLAEQTLVESDVRARYRVNVLEVQPHRANGRLQSAGQATRSPNGQRLVRPIPVSHDTTVHADDLLHVQGNRNDVLRFAQEQNLELCEADEPHRLLSRELGLAEIMPTPDSQMLGHTLRDLHFHDVHGLTVLSIRRMGKRLDQNPKDVQLRFGDTLLVEGPWNQIENLQQVRRNLVVVGLPAEMAEAGQASGRAWAAVAIMVGMLLLITFNVLPTVTAVLLAAVGMVLTGCLRPELLYRTIRWESVILIAGTLPMSTALEKSGGVEFIANLLTEHLGAFGPLAVLAGVFLITSAFSQFISNTATTVLVAPIAYTAAITLGVAPHAFLMAVAIAASSAFLTPIASPVNTIVLSPGGYHFSDFARVGVLLWMLMLGLVLLVLPVLFPL